MPPPQPDLPAHPVRLATLEAQGISRMQVRRMVARGELVELGRGLYAPKSFEPSARHALAIVAARVPDAVVCLLSALSFHGLTTEQPAEVWIALPPGHWRPRLGWPPLRVVSFSGARLQEGIERHRVEGLELQVYSVAKTVVDCFRFRNKIGLDVALAALREAVRKRRATPAQLSELAQRQRVATAFRPYLEAVS
jgi:predicted transcriptional regulator of viral defense system